MPPAPWHLAQLAPAKSVLPESIIAWVTPDGSPDFAAAAAPVPLGVGDETETARWQAAIATVETTTARTRERLDFISGSVWGGGNGWAERSCRWCFGCGR